MKSLKNIIAGTGMLLALTTVAEVNTEPVAHVQIATARMENTTRQITAYGRIVPAADGSIQLTAPFACRIVKVFAADGQSVKQGDLLFELAPDSDSQALLESTRQALSAAKQDLEETDARFTLKLADRQEVLHAKQAVTEAQLQMDRLIAQGLDGNGAVKAPCDGFIQQVNAKVGDLAGTGTSLTFIGRPDRRELVIGIEPGKASLLSIGQAFNARAVLRDTAQPLTGRILRIGQAIDPASGLVHVAASVDGSDTLAAQEYMEAKFDVDPRQALVIPASAVLPDENEQIVFTVLNGQATRHTVKTEALADGTVRIIDGDLSAGDHVVTLGNYELEDGMKVTVEDSK